MAIFYDVYHDTILFYIEKRHRITHQLLVEKKKMIDTSIVIVCNTISLVCYDDEFIITIKRTKFKCIN